jgi:hypothetical protein
MSELHFDLILLFIIIGLNILITILYRKYVLLREENVNGRINSGNLSPLVRTPSPKFSFMPRVPFLILSKTNNQKTKKIKILHNILCLIVYLLFVAAMFVLNK